MIEHCSHCGKEHETASGVKLGGVELKVCPDTPSADEIEEALERYSELLTQYFFQQWQQQRQDGEWPEVIGDEI